MMEFRLALELGNWEIKNFTFCHRREPKWPKLTKCKIEQKANERNFIFGLTKARANEVLWKWSKLKY